MAGRTGARAPLARAELTALLRAPGGTHPWPARLPSSRFGQIPGDEIDYVQVAPELVVEVETDTAAEHGRWRHATRFLRVRHDLDPAEVTVKPA